MTSEFYIRQVKRSSSSGDVLTDWPFKIGPFDSQESAEEHLSSIETDSLPYEYETIPASKARELRSSRSK